MGHILLEGGSEFGGRMEECDRRAIQLAGGAGARIRIVPTAAVPDDNHQRAGENGVRWFRSLGAVDVSSLPLTDPRSAADPRWAQELEGAQLIFILGGFPSYLAESSGAAGSGRPSGRRPGRTRFSPGAARGRWCSASGT